MFGLYRVSARARAGAGARRAVVSAAQPARGGQRGGFLFSSRVWPSFFFTPPSPKSNSLTQFVAKFMKVGVISKGHE